MTKNELLKNYNDHIELENHLLTIKDYLLLEGNNDSNQMSNEDLEIFLDKISNLPSYDYYHNTLWKSSIINACVNGTSSNTAAYGKKYCQYSYS